MPRFEARVAQRVRYPNGTCSEPFLASCSKAQMIAFAKDVLEGRWPQEVSHGSFRIDCALDCRFWNTLESWTLQYIGGLVGPIGVRERPDGTLSPGEMLPLFPQARHVESPWATEAFGVTDPLRAIALTTLKWAKSIEEW